MSTIPPEFFLERILMDYLPDKKEEIKFLLAQHELLEPIYETISEVSSFLSSKGDTKPSLDTLSEASFNAITKINSRVFSIKDKEQKARLQALLSDLFNAVVKEMSRRGTSTSSEIENEISKGLRIAASLKGYDKEDIFSRLTSLAEMSEAIERTRPTNLQPTSFSSSLSLKQLRYLAQCLQDHGITRRNNQFANLFSDSGKEIVPVICTTVKQIHFIHLLYLLIKEFKLVKVRNSSLWEGIKESFVDQDKNVLDKSIKQYYHRQIKGEVGKSLIDSEVRMILEGFFFKFPDAKQT